MLSYPVKLSKDEDSVLVSAPDFPELVTFGEDREAALLHAVDAFEEAIAGRIANREAIPAPSGGKTRVTLPTQAAVKALLYGAAREQGVGKAELARRMNCHLPQIDRLFDLNHGSRLDQIDAAFRALGVSLSVKTERSRAPKNVAARKVAAKKPAVRKTAGTQSEALSARTR